MGVVTIDSNSNIYINIYIYIFILLKNATFTAFL